MATRPQAPPQPALGREIQRLREAARLSKLRAAERAGLANSYWGQLERGWIWQWDSAAHLAGHWKPVQRPRRPTLDAIVRVLAPSPADAQRLYTLAGLDAPAPMREHRPPTGPSTPRPPASGSLDALPLEALDAVEQFVRDAVTAERARRGQGPHGGDDDAGTHPDEPGRGEAPGQHGGT